MKISVVIPSYNAEKTIVPCLSSLMDQDIEESFEVIVVDSSDDATPHIIREKFPDVGLIHLDGKTGPGIARNLGVKRAKGDVIAFIDSDCVADRSWLRKIGARHASGHTVVGGAVENGDLYSPIGWASYLCEFSPWFPRGKQRWVTHIATCNSSYGRMIFDRYGGFTTGPFPPEDFLYNRILHTHGERILFDPDIRVTHSHRTSIRGVLGHQARRGRGAAQIRRAALLPDSFVIDPLFKPVTVPVLTVMKLVANIYRLLRWKPSMLFLLPLILPPYLLGLLFWTIGFVDGGLHAIKTE